MSLSHRFLSYSVRERIRTPDTLVRSQVLYPAELHTHIIKLLFKRVNAVDRNRTGTMSPPRDFKSRASASSATPAPMDLQGLEPGTDRL